LWLFAKAEAGTEAEPLLSAALTASGTRELETEGIRSAGQKLAMGSANRTLLQSLGRTCPEHLWLRVTSVRIITPILSLIVCIYLARLQ